MLCFLVVSRGGRASFRVLSDSFGFFGCGGSCRPGLRRTRWTGRLKHCPGFVPPAATCGPTRGTGTVKRALTCVYVGCLGRRDGTCGTEKRPSPVRRRPFSPAAFPVAPPVPPREARPRAAGRPRALRPQPEGARLFRRRAGGRRTQGRRWRGRARGGRPWPGAAGPRPARPRGRPDALDLLVDPPHQLRPVGALPLQVGLVARPSGVAQQHASVRAGEAAQPPERRGPRPPVQLPPLAEQGVPSSKTPPLFPFPLAVRGCLRTCDQPGKSTEPEVNRASERRLVRWCGEAERERKERKSREKERKRERETVWEGLRPVPAGSAGRPGRGRGWGRRPGRAGRPAAPRADPGGWSARRRSARPREARPGSRRA